MHAVSYVCFLCYGCPHGGNTIVCYIIYGDLSSIALIRWHLLSFLCEVLINFHDRAILETGVGMSICSDSSNSWDWARNWNSSFESLTCLSKYNFTISCRNAWKVNFCTRLKYFKIELADPKLFLCSMYVHSPCFQGLESLERKCNFIN